MAPAQAPQTPAHAAASSVPPPPASVVAAADRTVREVIPPWHVIKQKAEARASRAPLALIEPPPPSGVRLSEPPQPAARIATPVVASPTPAAPPEPPGELVVAAPSAAPLPPTDDSRLTYRVYTVADLERTSDAPVSMRASRVVSDTTTARTRALLVRAWGAVATFLRAAKAWATAQGSRPDPRVALREPFDAMGDELELVVRSVDWKRVGVSFGIAVGASLTLLFAVLTVAELTDDLKPASGPRMSLEAPGLPPTPSLGAPAAAATTMAPAAVVAPVAAAEPASDTLEIDPPAPPAPAAKRGPLSGKKAQGKKKLAFRNADEIFKP